MIQITDKEKLFERLVRYPFLNIYHLADLDESYRKHSEFFTNSDDTADSPIILKYSKFDIPVLICIVPEVNDMVLNVWKEMLPQLPEFFYLHADNSILEYLGNYFDVQQNNESIRMGLNPENFVNIESEKFTFGRVQEKDSGKIKAFLKKHYPENWFDHDLISTGMFKYIADDNEWIAFGGIHTYSKTYKTAALGSIAVHNDFRGKGIGTLLTSKLCSDLLKTCDYIALNVRADNPAAINCYKKIGFTEIKKYKEALLCARL